VASIKSIVIEGFVIWRNINDIVQVELTDRRGNTMYAIVDTVSDELIFLSKYEEETDEYMLID